MLKFFAELWKNKRGATAIEYGLIAALIAATIAGSVTTLGTKVQSTFQNVANAINP